MASVDKKDQDNINAVEAPKTVWRPRHDPTPAVKAVPPWALANAPPPPPLTSHYALWTPNINKSDENPKKKTIAKQYSGDPPTSKSPQLNKTDNEVRDISNQFGQTAKAVSSKDLDAQSMSDSSIDQKSVKKMGDAQGISTIQVGDSKTPQPLRNSESAKNTHSNTVPWRTPISSNDSTMITSSVTTSSVSQVKQEVISSSQQVQNKSVEIVKDAPWRSPRTQRKVITPQNSSSWHPNTNNPPVASGPVGTAVNAAIKTEQVKNVPVSIAKEQSSTAENVSSVSRTTNTSLAPSVPPPRSEATVPPPANPPFFIGSPRMSRKAVQIPKTQALNQPTQPVAAANVQVAATTASVPSTAAQTILAPVVAPSTDIIGSPANPSPNPIEILKTTETSGSDDTKTMLNSSEQNSEAKDKESVSKESNPAISLQDQIKSLNKTESSTNSEISNKPPDATVPETIVPPPSSTDKNPENLTTNANNEDSLPPPPKKEEVLDSNVLSPISNDDLPPPPPQTLLSEIQPKQPVPPQTLLIPEPVHEEKHSSSEERPFDKDSPEYVAQSVTARIKGFEKQKSGEEVIREVPPAKPIGPWVKKTSSGIVKHGSWGPFSGEESDYPESPDEPNTVFIGNKNASKSTIKAPIKIQAKEIQQTNSSKSEKSERPSTLHSATETPQDISCHYLDRPLSMPNSGDCPLPSPAAAEPKDKKLDDPLFDPWCDPKNPRQVQIQDVIAAGFKIKSGIMNTPCNKSHMSSLTGVEIFFKKEFNQFTGSFKERGARYTLLQLPEDQKKKGVIAASAGNHALALSYHGQDLGIPVTVVMPLVAPIMKVQACKQYGANVMVQGHDIGESREIALRICKKEGQVYINGYDHPHVIAGQGTMGLEIVEQVENIDAVVVPVGGAGLIAGVALAVKAFYPNIQVIGVESEKCASFGEAIKHGSPKFTKAQSTLADGLAVPTVGVNAFVTAKPLVDKVVTVKEEWIAIAILRLVELEKAVVEGAGATALAAILAGELPELKGKRVVIPLCGGNIDTTILGRCLERGLAADGRLVKFTVTVSDRPGGIAELTRLLASLGVSIKDMVHERAWIKSDIFCVQCVVVCETKDHRHFFHLKNTLSKKYKEFTFPDPKQLASKSDGTSMLPDVPESELDSLGDH